MAVVTELHGRLQTSLYQAVRMNSRMSTVSRMQSRMSTARLQYLTDEEEEEDIEEGEEDFSYKPKISITISKNRSQLKRPVCFSDQVTPQALHLTAPNC